MGQRLKDLTGMRFGALLVVSVVGRAANGDHRWLCKCDCGKETAVFGGDLRRAPKPGRNPTSSCGCRAHLPSKHNGRGTPEYRAWVHMKERCRNPNDKSYKNYGARGITVYAGWLKDFPAFLAHVGPRPSASHTIDRIDNNKGYEPGNLRWATRVEQIENRRNTRHVKLPDGTMATIRQAAEITGTPLGTLKARAYRPKWAGRLFEPKTREAHNTVATLAEVPREPEPAPECKIVGNEWRTHYCENGVKLAYP